MLTVENRIPNRLIDEKSPYLLQHAYNPVDWFPWGEEAFAKAKTEDKPIFLSIGYSCCHWCHVMERESFEDEKLAQILNDGFVSIKVDKEERPDIDSIYMDACQLMTGSGGWPLSLFLDHDGNCFYAGTYFPNHQFAELLGMVSQAFLTKRNKLLEQSKELTKYINKQSETHENTENFDLCASAYNHFRKSFDMKYGGFGFAPKFPSPHNLLFLMEHYLVRRETSALSMAEKTLNSWDAGGIHDHVGGGYHRYSTDERWLVPHFEKMLYDNAMIAIAFAKCYEITKNTSYRAAASHILDYILRDMTDEKGGFYSAEDADSEGEEGLFYVWSPKEVLEILGADGKSFCECYDITEKGNFEGKNIPNQIGKSYTPMKNALQKLFEQREKRIHPFKDKKILTGWNGLMIAAFSICGRLFEETRFIRTAENALAFIHTSMRDKEGNLLSVYKDDIAKNHAHLEDIAFLSWGILELHKSTWKLSHLIQAIQLCDYAISNFYDGHSGGFFLTSNLHEKLIAKSKPLYDGAYPSPNSVLLHVIQRIAFMTGVSKYEKIIKDTKMCFSSKASSSPMAYSYYLLSELFEETTPNKIILIGSGSALEEMAQACRTKVANNDEVVVIDTSDKSPAVKEYFGTYQTKDNMTTAYVCSGKRCYPPITDLAELKKLSLT